MRTAGRVEHVRGLGSHDHVCWGYDDPAEFVREAREFLADGLSKGHQVWFVAPGSVDALQAQLRGVEGIDEALHRGAARVVSLDATFPGAVVDPRVQARACRKATEQAVAAGFTGLRVAVECSSLVRTPEQLAAFAAYEHAVDHYMAGRPFSALCAYRRGPVSEAALAQVACMHPAANAAADPGFRLFGSHRHAAALGGSLDVAHRELFAEALRRTEPRPAANAFVVDATELRFLDHRNLLLLAEHADRHARTLVLRTAWPGAARLVDLLRLRNVRVETA